jgi:hypothetical protein
VAKAVQERYSQQPGPLSSEIQPAPRVSSKTQDFASRYQYVVPEIKRIGIIAGSIILVLVILSFILG